MWCDDTIVGFSASQLTFHSLCAGACDCSTISGSQPVSRLAHDVCSLWSTGIHLSVSQCDGQTERLREVERGRKRQVHSHAHLIWLLSQLHTTRVHAVLAVVFVFALCIREPRRGAAEEITTTSRAEQQRMRTPGPPKSYNLVSLFRCVRPRAWTPSLPPSVLSTHFSISSSHLKLIFFLGAIVFFSCCVGVCVCVCV